MGYANSACRPSWIWGRFVTGKGENREKKGKGKRENDKKREGGIRKRRSCLYFLVLSESG